MENTLKAPSTASRRFGATDALRASAVAAGLAAMALAIYHVVTPGSPGGATYESLSDYWREVGFLVYLASSVVAVLTASRVGISGRAGAWMVGSGYVLIAFGVAVGLIVREELDWFFVVAGPGLLLSTIGFIVFAVGIWRRSSLPRWAAIMCGVGGAVAILMSEFGTGVLIGSFWLFVATNPRPRTRVIAAERADP